VDEVQDFWVMDVSSEDFIFYAPVASYPCVVKIKEVPDADG
jgi:hypothetical protein